MAANEPAAAALAPPVGTVLVVDAVREAETVTDEKLVMVVSCAEVVVVWLV